MSQRQNVERKNVERQIVHPLNHLGIGYLGTWLWAIFECATISPKPGHADVSYDKLTAFALAACSSGIVVACHRGDWSYVWVVRSNPVRVGMYMKDGSFKKPFA
jgi:hypothetical protein